MSVEASTAQLANTTLKDSTAGPGGELTNASQNEAVIASAQEGRRLYIGNLAYATTEGELKEFFKEYLVETISIPLNPRIARPVGYAFVDVSTPSEAERAIAELSGKTILDRKISVQLARKPEAAGPGAAAGTDGEGEEGARRRPSARGRGRGGRTRGGRSGRGGRAHDGEADTNGAHGTAAQVLPLNDITNDNPPTAGGDGTRANKDGARRPLKQRGPPEDGIASKTKVMVANLPYEMGEDKLLELFAEYKPSSAKIALRPIPKFMIKKLQARNEPRKGRGFGFVNLASEELQQKAVADLNGKEIEGREIAVKVAIDSPGKEDEDPNATSTNGTEQGTSPAAATA